MVQIPRKQTQMTLQNKAPAAGRGTGGGNVTMPNTQAAVITKPVNSQQKQNLNWQQQNENLRDKLGQYQVGSPEYNRIVNRINFNRGKQGLTARDASFFTKFAAQPQAQTPTTETPATTPAPDAGIPTAQTPVDATADIANATFTDTDLAKTAEGFLGTGSYDWRVNQSRKNLDRLMASRGLVASGAEIEANRDMMDKLAGEEMDRAYGLAGTQIGLRENQGGQYRDWLAQQAEFKNKVGQQQFDNMMNVTKLQADQNPMGYISDMTQYGTSMGYKYGQDKANSIASNYAKYYGGGGGSTPWIPPYPTAPDYSGISAGEALAGGSSNSDYLGTILSGIGMVAGL